MPGATVRKQKKDNPIPELPCLKSNIHRLLSQLNFFDFPYQRLRIRF